MKKLYNHVEIEMIQLMSDDVLFISNENETDIVLPENPSNPGTGGGSGSGSGSNPNESDRA